MQFDLRDDIPVQHSPRVKGESKYGLHLLTKVGQSLTYPADTDYRKLARAAHMRAARYGWFAAVRRMSDGTIRVWRAQNEAPTIPTQSTQA